MDTKATSIVAYITLIGTIIALVAGDKKGANFHINQALVIFVANIIFNILARIPIVGGIIGLVGGLFVLVCWVMGLIAAIKQEEKEVPLIGKIKLLNN
jgi:uncharacterized membrane protein